MTRAEVAALFGVDGRTIWRWVRDQKLAAVVTPSGRKYRRSDINAMLAALDSPALTSRVVRAGDLGGAS
jgi:excisionase family DNA binding protein